jgi:hypothetical protein
MDRLRPAHHAERAGEQPGALLSYLQKPLISCRGYDNPS